MFKESLKIKMDFRDYIKGLVFYKVIFVLLSSHTFHLVLFYRIDSGVSTHSRMKIKELIIKTLYPALKKYPKEKNYINSQFLVLFLLDLKNKRYFKDYLYGYLKTFSVEGFFLMIKTWKIRRMFSIEK